MCGKIGIVTGGAGSELKLAARPVASKLPVIPACPANVVTIVPTLAVSVAAVLVALPPVFVAMHWNWSPVMPVVTLLTTRLAVVEPL